MASVGEEVSFPRCSGQFGFSYVYKEDTIAEILSSEDLGMRVTVSFRSKRYGSCTEADAFLF